MSHTQIKITKKPQEKWNLEQLQSKKNMIFLKGTSVLETNMVDLHLESTCGLKEVSTTSSLITDESILGIKDKPILIATVWFDLWPY